jgi:hypothetical protein
MHEQQSSPRAICATTATSKEKDFTIVVQFDLG